MKITWQDIDRWRAEKGLTNSDLARLAGISESSIYRGLNRKSRLYPGTRRAMHSAFPDKLNERGEVRA